jgi:hypothetical protein
MIAGGYCQNGVGEGMLGSCKDALVVFQTPQYQWSEGIQIVEEATV